MNLEELGFHAAREIMDDAQQNWFPNLQIVDGLLLGREQISLAEVEGWRGMDEGFKAVFRRAKCLMEMVCEMNRSLFCERSFVCSLNSVKIGTDERRSREWNSRSLIRRISWCVGASPFGKKFVVI